MSVLILAAGRSKRFRTSSNKVLYPICGRPAIQYLLQTVATLKPNNIRLVIAKPHHAVFKEACLPFKCQFSYQIKPLGSGDAARSGLKDLPSKGYVLILSGDGPLISAATLQKLIHRVHDCAALGGVLSMVLPEGGSYGRVVKDLDGQAMKIVEAKDANAYEHSVNEVNAGVYYVQVAWLKSVIGKLGRHNAQGEYYLTDIVSRAYEHGDGFVVVESTTPTEMLGMNTRAEAAQINKMKRLQIAARHMDAGVDIVDPENVYIDDMVKIEAGSHIGPGVCLMGNTRVGTDVYIHAYSVLQDAVVGGGAVIGPFARLRPGAVLESEVRVGNFVEIKKTRMKKGAKANHLTYLGDAVIGEGTNVGCGTITCNYDGVAKYKTTIGKNVFVGSDVAFVAPVKIGDGATIAAGSVVTKNVPKKALAIARGRQANVKGWKRKSRT